MATAPQRAQVLDALQLLTRDKVSLQGNRVTLGVNNRSKGFAVGTELVRRLVASPQTVTVSPFVGSNAFNSSDALARSAAAVVAHQPTDVFVRLDVRPTSVYVATSEGLIRTEAEPLHIALGHELIHADHITQGTVVGGLQPATCLARPARSTSRKRRNSWSSACPRPAAWR